MGRRKKIIDPIFPSRPVPLVDAMLYAEPDIRRAVEEEREAFSYIGGRDPLGRKGKGGLSDKTAKAALRIASDIPSVVLEDGRTVKKPEAWLTIFDEVRERAQHMETIQGIEQAKIIMDEWRSMYGKEIVFISRDLPISYFRQARSWIRSQVLIRAREADLVSFSLEEIEEAIQEAERDPWDSIQF